MTVATTPQPNEFANEQPMSTKTPLAERTGSIAMQSYAFAPRDLGQLIDYCQLISRSSLVPDAYRGKVGDIILAIQFGAEIGLKPMQALQGVMVVNGKPTVFGDHMIGIVRGNPLCEGIEEWVEGEADKRIAYCRAKRRGEAEPIVRSFSVLKAKEAGLWGKAGPWKLYPDRMLQMRARSFALRDGFADVLKGISMYEEVIDIEPVTVESTAQPIGNGKPTRSQQIAEKLAAVNPVAQETVAEEAPAPNERASAGEMNKLQEHGESLGLAPDVVNEIIYNFGDEILNSQLDGIRSAIEAEAKK